MKKAKRNQKDKRVLARRLARKLTDAELKALAGGNDDSGATAGSPDGFHDWPDIGG